MSSRQRLKTATEKARRVSFFRNGDYFDPGIRLAFRGKKPFATMYHLLDYLSQKIRMPARKIFSVSEGKRVWSMDQLKDGESYVVSSDGKYQPLPYGSVPRLTTSHVKDALPVRPEDIQLLRPTQGLAGRKKTPRKFDERRMEKLSTTRKEGRLLFIAAKETGASTTFLFNDRNPPSFEQILKDFANALGLKEVHQMSTASGRQVRSISQLKNEFYDVDTFYLEGNNAEFEHHENPEYTSNPKFGAKSGRYRSRPFFSVNKKIPKAAWIHGYNGNTLLMLESGELVYSVAAAVVLYDRVDDMQRHYLGHTEDVCSLCVHPSSSMMASGQVLSLKSLEASIHIWMVEGLQIIARVSRLMGSPVSIAFSSEDNVLMSVEAGPEQDCLSFWDWESDGLLARIEMQGERLTGGIFHPSEPELAVTFGVHHLAIWKRRSDGFLGRTDALEPGHSTRTILSWAFIGDATLAVGDSSGYVTLWLLAEDSFRIQKEIKAHQSEIRCLLAMREGTLISGGGDQLKAWDSHQRLVPLATANLPEGPVQSICQQATGGVSLYVGTPQSILEGSLQSSFKTLVQGVEIDTLDLAVDSEGSTFISVDQSHHVYRWTIRHLVWKTKSLVDLCCVAFHPEGRVVTAGGTNGKLLVLHANGGLVVATISVADVPLKKLSYDSDGSTLAIGCEDGNIYVCQSQNHGYLYKMHTVLKNEWPILHIDWSIDGLYLQSAYRKDDFYEVTLWKVNESKIMKPAIGKTMDWPEHTCNLSYHVVGIWKRIKNAFFLTCHRKDSKLATGAQDGHIRIFSYPCYEYDKGEYEEWRQSSQPVNIVRFLKKNVLVTTSGSTIFVWKVKK